MLPFAFEEGMGFERYVDYALQVPMYFVKRGDHYHDVTGQRFGDLLAGKLPGLPGERAYVSDWANHLSTIFPEVRLKRYLEMRGADVGPRPMICAQSAFWVGLFYCRASLDAAWDIAKGWSAEERQKLRDDVPRLGFEAEIRGRKMLDLARELLAISRNGLKSRARLDRHGRDETMFLDPLFDLVDAGKTQADLLIEKFSHDWAGKVTPVFETNAY
jgi:glutamate--cysteine ligase